MLCHGLAALCAGRATRDLTIGELISAYKKGPAYQPISRKLDFVCFSTLALRYVGYIISAAWTAYLVDRGFLAPSPELKGLSH